MPAMNQDLMGWDFGSKKARLIVTRIARVLHVDLWTAILKRAKTDAKNKGVLEVSQIFVIFLIAKIGTNSLETVPIVICANSDTSL